MPRRFQLRRPVKGRPTILFVMREVEIDLLRMEPLLEKLFLFKSLSNDMKDRFLEESVVVIADPDEVIISQGDRQGSVYILIEGEVEVSTLRDDEQVFLKVLKPHAIIGEISAMTQQPRTATVTAASHCSLIRIESGLIREIIEQNPKVKGLLEAIWHGREKDTVEKMSGE